MTHEQQLEQFVARVEEFCHSVCPEWLTPNSVGMGIEPGHNLDLLKVWFDFRVDRSSLLLSETPTVLQDPSKPEMRVIK